MPPDDFTAVFAKLKSILKKYEKRCAVDVDTDTEYFLNSKKSERMNKPTFFAGVSINKVSISFYLNNADSSSEIRDSLSPELRKCLHGKSCFRFKRDEPKLFKELIALTNRVVPHTGSD
ncbi:MAG: DUF1801 domain-containing protein [Planctomycetia bacterium]|nr:DUF1801 domain-containing protein [Planctomycetia bacterium]